MAVEPDTRPWQSPVRDLTQRGDVDIFTYNGMLLRPFVNEFIDKVNVVEDRKKNFALFLTTLGGDGDAAYKMASFIRDKYSKFYLYCYSVCKSAGTLVALGASEIIMYDYSELGPLDVQMRKIDEIVSFGSGLDILQAINSISGYSINLFDSFLERLTDGYGGILTTKTCAEISSTLARGLLEPVAAQIDPLQLGEAHRAMSIAKRYGALLDTGNLRERAINRLVEDYPAHSFVIDLREAKKLFHNVRRPSDLEIAVGRVFHEALIDPQRRCMICDVRTLDEQGDAATEMADAMETRTVDGSSDSRGDQRGDRSDPAPSQDAAASSRAVRGRSTDRQSAARTRSGNGRVRRPA
jgi:hypothetical protein